MATGKKFLEKLDAVGKTMVSVVEEMNGEFSVETIVATFTEDFSGGTSYSRSDLLCEWLMDECRRRCAHDEFRSDAMDIAFRLFAGGDIDGDLQLDAARMLQVLFDEDKKTEKTPGKDVEKVLPKNVATTTKTPMTRKK